MERPLPVVGAFDLVIKAPTGVVRLRPTFNAQTRRWLITVECVVCGSVLLEEEELRKNKALETLQRLAHEIQIGALPLTWRCAVDETGAHQFGSGLFLAFRAAWYSAVERHERARASLRGKSPEAWMKAEALQEEAETLREQFSLIQEACLQQSLSGGHQPPVRKGYDARFW